jgi:hypothetical protein
VGRRAGSGRVDAMLNQTVDGACAVSPPTRIATLYTTDYLVGWRTSRVPAGWTWW